MKISKWNVDKNEILFSRRGVTFEEIVQKIESGAKYIETDHPNRAKYPNQRLLSLKLKVMHIGFPV